MHKRTYKLKMYKSISDYHLGKVAKSLNKHSLKEAFEAAGNTLRRPTYKAVEVFDQDNLIIVEVLAKYVA